jgi:uncharacterized damage-inducible protein DinB
MPDPLSTIFISSSHIGSDARESAGVSICQSVLHVEAYRWILCGGPPSGSSSAQRSTCSKTRLFACPSTQWTGRLWSDQKDHPQPSEFAAFWSITHHTLFWLDLYLTGSLEGFAPPTPFTTDELEPARVLPEQPYTKDELHTYLVHLRKKCQTTIAGLSDEQAHQQVAFRWVGEKPMSFLELLLYTMRHVQEHAAQLNLFLGQNGSSGASDWVSRAKADAGG